MQENLVRRTRPIPVDAAGIEIGEKIRQAREAADAKKKVAHNTQREINRTEVNVEDVAAVLSPRSEVRVPRSEEFSNEEISHLFAND